MTTEDTTRVAQDRRLQWVKIADLKVDLRGQRDYDPAWAQDLANRFDPDKIQTPHVSIRDDGSKWLMDGQHTVGAMRLVGWGDQSLQCWIYRGLTVEQEADMYLSLNDRKTQTALNKFKVAVNAGYPDESDIDRIARNLGLHVGTDGEAGGMTCPGALTRVYKLGGPKALQRSLRIARDAYGDPGLTGPVIHGLGLVCHRYNGELDDEAATISLANANGGVGGLTNRAAVIRKQLGGTVAAAVAAAAVDIINQGKGRQKKLPGWFKAS